MFDPSRTYRAGEAINAAYGETKAPRPILVNVWYPARSGSGVEMTHNGYFDITPGAPPSVVPLAGTLSRYARDVAAAETLGRSVSELTEEDRQAALALFAKPIVARRGAEEATGRFPLIIYHPGYGSSFEDNAVLCEFLASHGYVVVSSAFFRRDGRSFNIDAAEGSLADIGFLIADASQWSNVDWSRIALMGHSGGAHTTLRYQASGQSAVNALVSLDTTQDSHNLDNPAWDMVGPVLENLEHMSVPALFAAPPTALYQLAERMEHADRYLVTVPSIGHNEFISQGVVRAETSTPPAADAGEVREQYDRLARTVLAFLDAVLKNDASSMEKLTSSNEPSLVDQIELMPRGARSPAPYDMTSSVAPTAGQLRNLAEDQGLAGALTLLDEFRSQEDLPIYDQLFAAVWLRDLVTAGKTVDAQALFAFYRDLSPRLADGIKRHLRVWSTLLETENGAAAAIPWQRTIVLLYPDDADAMARLETLEPPPSERGGS